MDRRISQTAVIALLCVCLLISAKVSGFGNDGLCNSRRFYEPSSFGGFDCGGEFIWWKLCLDHPEYAVVDDEMTDFPHRRVKYHSLCSHRKPGGRAWAYAPSAFSGNCGLYASYTGISSKNHESVSVDAGEGNVGIGIPLAGFQETMDFTQATAFRNVHYHDFDLLFTYACHCGDCSFFRPFFGFAGLIVDQGLHVTGKTLNTVSSEPVQVNDVKWKSDLFAYGLRIGTEYHWQFVGCLSLFGKFSASVLTGEPDTSNRQVLREESVVVQEKLKVSEGDCYRAYPGYHLAAGAMYDRCFCHVTLSVKIGYEFVEWNNLPHHRRFVSNDPTQGTGSTDRTFGWQGVLVGGGIGF